MQVFLSFPPLMGPGQSSSIPCVHFSQKVFWEAAQQSRKEQLCQYKISIPSYILGIYRVIPCQINTKKSLPSQNLTNIGSYTVSVC